MKCPNCQNNQKYKDGMICNMCKYHFALNPKEKYGMSDQGFKALLDKLSGAGQFYYTYNQLYAQVYRAIRKKHHPGFLGLSCAGIFLTIIAYSVLVGAFGLGWQYPAAFFFVFMIFAFILNRRSFKLGYDVPGRIIETYKIIHPLENLADGTKFKHLDKTSLDAEFFKYAPERILITEHDDMADMLLLNRFHFDNKTLVVSAQKYPYAAFEACQGFLANHPDIPVLLIHDCSDAGLKMQGKLLTDKSWNLEGRNINNLGLHPKDVDKLKSPVWIPYDKDKTILLQGAAHENIEQGFKMPLDIAPPSSMIGTLGIAMAAGLALLSDDLLAMQRENAGGMDSFGGGFG
ncbi:DNA topoisomerase VI subunit A domain-containing protein [Desulfonema limicola]|uniref:DNA topoisomerase VI subunit A domain-containing protein n=1 Tax=Desulfonema limicola TaxID=45656 RepID=A0A975B403_9BACT|nr:hypothetical protein [Desulfonema limicola]QTA78379.1 DNA topoisomerase VI subunit A domain-containing protein [Desulfonema limicola]